MTPERGDPQASAEGEWSASNERISDAVSTAFTPLIGLPCWGVVRMHGSMLSMEFGSPHLHVREPIASTSTSAKVRERMARRHVKPVGQWSLHIWGCHWRVFTAAEMLAEDEDSQARIDAAMRPLDGQKLTAFRFDGASRATILDFDLGVTLRTCAYAVDEDEQWSLYQPDGLVLTCRADGKFSLGPGSEKPDQQVWQAVPGSVRVT